MFAFSNDWFGAVQVAERSTEVEVGFFAEYAKPTTPLRRLQKETRVINDFTHELAIKTAIAIVLAGPLQVVAFDAAVAQADVGAEHEVVRFFAVATHFFGIRTGKMRA